MHACPVKNGVRQRYTNVTLDLELLSDEISALADSLRARDALGRSDVLNRLFDYLVEASLAGAKPKEVEVAARVFRRDADFDGAQDASVRVAVHRLRKKLEQFYAEAGSEDPIRMAIPRGEYRFVAQAAKSRPQKDTAAAPGRPPWRAVLAAMLLINALAWAAWWTSHRDEGYGRLRRTAPWSQLLESKRPLLVAVGDYYIFGDIDEATGAGRLVREYGVNSAQDLEFWLMNHPEAVGRYRDLNLFYLPVGAAAVLRDVLPVLTPKAAAREGVRVVTASDLTPEMLKRYDVLYIGYFSALRLLRDPAFAGSRFRIGDTYDELVDARTGQRYESQEGGPAEGQASKRDFGYFAAFPGPTGNRIVILAGARDVGLMQTAEAVTNPANLKALSKAVGGAEAFEALYEAEGMRRANLGGRLVVASPLDAARIWSPLKDPPRFPAG